MTRPSSARYLSIACVVAIAQIAASALPAGGVATVKGVAADGRFSIIADAAGPRARLRPGPRGRHCG